ncbi:serine incorporator 5-like isoform X3 [Homarus americanus]|uniref:serine incorporator 5-like isoform X3 n=1 Tax=Homarus americanus TaxID=6706 RepID=UPI001C45F13E|nr:serine incorporator 5-like isoform X3 [Homarus americanus]
MSGMYGEEEYIEGRSCCRAQVGCMCGTSSCRFCCRLCPSVLESTSTRIVYIVFLMLSVGVMALMMSLRVQDAIMEMFPDHDEVCEWIGAGENCEVALGYMAVYRLGFAVTAYHFLLMLITCGVKSSRDCRAGLHNGMWFYKFLLLMFFCFGSFFIPDPNDLFINVWMYTAMSGAGLFIVIQLLLLVFLFHSWTDKLVARVNNGGSSICWYGGPKDVRLRLLHSSLISLYVIYLTWTAIGSAPRKFQKIDVGEKLGIWIGAGHDVRSNILLPEQEYYCGPNGKEESWADEVLPYVSLILTFFLVVYSAIGTATPDNCQAIEFPSCPSRQSVQRHDVEDVGGQKVIRNESNDLAYSYPLFHIMLGLATLYLMMSLTDWYTPSTARLITFGRSWSAVWIKMSSSWVCLLIYLTVTLFPTMLPNKTSRTGPINGTISNGYAGSFRGSARSLDDEAAVPLSPSKPTTTIHQETTV